MRTFQGKDVQASKIKFSGGAKELFDDAPEIDQIVSVQLDGRVTGVELKVNESTGDLEEHVRVKVMDVDQVSTMSTPHTVTTPSGKTVNTSTGEVADDEAA